MIKTNCLKSTDRPGSNHFFLSPSIFSLPSYSDANDSLSLKNFRAAQASLPSGMVLNIATGRRTSLNQLVHLLNEIFGAQQEPIYEAERMGDIRHSRANTRLSKDLLGDYNVAALRDGLVKTVKWFSESSGRIKRCE